MFENKQLSLIEDSFKLLAFVDGTQGKKHA